MVLRRTGRLIGRVWRGTLLLVLALIASAATVVVLVRWVDPPITPYHVQERLRLGAIALQWRPLAAMSRNVPLAAVAAEDANFCNHWGFDIDGIRAALADRDRLRGGSTISQQVAKNVFLWQGRTWTRKGLEAVITVLIEATWPKQRILEVYLNVAEMDAGVFGVEAAARHYWGAGAAELGLGQAARLMAVLPDPKGRSPIGGTRFIARRGSSIAQGAATIRADGRAGCFL